MHIRKFAAIGAVAFLVGLGASAPAQAGIIANGFMMNGFMMNGLKLNGLKLNGLRLNGLRFNGLRFNGLNHDGLAQAVGLNFNALKLHAVVLPTGAQ